MGLRSLFRGPLRWVVGAWAVIAVAGLVMFGLSGGLSDWFSGPGGSPGPAPQAARPAVLPSPGPPARRAAFPPAVTPVATVLRSVPRYDRPGQRGQGLVPSSWWGRPSVLPVIATQPGWVRVRLAQRPDGSTAWVPAGDVRLGATPYAIVIHLATTRLDLFRHGRLVLSAPAGVGAATDPTPPGEYFTAFKEPPPGPGYGAFVLVTSAHSPDIADWEGSGDGIIGIHGPLGEDARIGTTGARISHGCVRLHAAALSRLAPVPPGTPVDITR